MSYGIPSLCLNTGSYKELVGKEVTNRFFKIDDVNLTNKIKLSLEKLHLTIIIIRKKLYYYIIFNKQNI